jgi:hypothetical protein
MVDAALLQPPEQLSAREPQFARFSDQFIARTDPAAGAKRLEVGRRCFAVFAVLAANLTT